MRLSVHGDAQAHVGLLEAFIFRALGLEGGNVEALTTRIGFWGILYFESMKEPPTWYW